MASIHLDLNLTFLPLWMYFVNYGGPHQFIDSLKKGQRITDLAKSPYSLL